MTKPVKRQVYLFVYWRVMLRLKQQVGWHTDLQVRGRVSWRVPPQVREQLLEGVRR